MANKVLSEVFSLAGKNIMITGGSSGLGAHFGKLMASAGAPSVVLAARRAEKLEHVASSISTKFPECKVVCVSLDVTSRDSIKNAFDSAEAELGGEKINVLVNNAGIANPKLSMEVEEPDWDGLLNTNLKGAFFVSQEACRRLIAAKQPGQVINIASILGLRVGTSQVNYGVAKAGLLHMSKTMAAELSRYNIRVNSICPGYFETEMNFDFFQTEPGKAYLKRIPPKRLGQMEELNGPLLLLASNASSFMTGTEVVVDLGHINATL
jgi:NAD(P)-dependent dehydrogenase (short-subunit alcohol dehydrogenase family)